MDSFTILWPLLAVLLILFYGALLIRARRCQKIPEASIRQYGFKLPFIAPLGMFLVDRLPYCPTTTYNRNISILLSQLFGNRNIDTMYKVHLSQKYSLTITTLFVCFILFLATESEPTSLIFILILTTLVSVWVDKDLEKRIKNKKQEILIDLPEFINALALLINAGLPYIRAVQKVAADKGQHRPLYRELNSMLADINAGKSASQAHEEFAQRCRLGETTRFVSAVLQNMNRGNADLVYVLRNLACEAWETRKDIARKRGEEASSKLVFPMVMVFVAVSIIVLAPAVITMSR